MPIRGCISFSPLAWNTTQLRGRAGSSFTVTWFTNLSPSGASGSVVCVMPFTITSRLVASTQLARLTVTVKSAVAGLPLTFEPGFAPPGPTTVMNSPPLTVAVPWASTSRTVLAVSLVGSSWPK